MTRLNKEEMKSAEIIACFWHSQIHFPWILYKHTRMRACVYLYATLKPASEHRTHTNHYCCIMIKLYYGIGIFNQMASETWNGVSDRKILNSIAFKLNLFKSKRNSREKCCSFYYYPNDFDSISSVIVEFANNIQNGHAKQQCEGRKKWVYTCETIDNSIDDSDLNANWVETEKNCTNDKSTHCNVNINLFRTPNVELHIKWIHVENRTIDLHK